MPGDNDFFDDPFNLSDPWANNNPTDWRNYTMFRPFSPYNPSHQQSLQEESSKSSERAHCEQAILEAHKNLTTQCSQNEKSFSCEKAKDELEKTLQCRR